MTPALAEYLFSNEVLFFYPVEKTEKNSAPGKPVSETAAIIQASASRLSPIPDSANKDLFMKPLLILVHQLNPEERDFLGKILASVRHSFENVVLFDLSRDDHFPSEEFFRQQNTKRVLSFGVAMSKIDSSLLAFPYQKKNHRGFDFLMTDSLSAISLNQKDEKKLLWTALKEMFH